MEGPVNMNACVCPCHLPENQPPDPNHVCVCRKVYEVGKKFMLSDRDTAELRGQEKAEHLAMLAEWLGIPKDSPKFQEADKAEVLVLRKHKPPII